MFRSNKAWRIHRVSGVQPPHLLRRRVDYVGARDTAMERFWMWGLHHLRQGSRARSKNRRVDEARGLSGRVPRTVPSAHWTVAERQTFGKLLESSCKIPASRLMFPQKTVGSYNLVTLEDGLEGMTLRLLTQVLDWKPEAVQVLLAHVRKDFRDPRIHAQIDL